MRNTNYLKRYNDQTSFLAKEEGVPEDEIIFMIDQLFFDLRDMFEDPRIPTIKLTNLGTFKTTIGKLHWHIHMCQDLISKGVGDLEALQKRIDYLSPILDRLKREKAGESTWKEWRDKYKNDESKSKKQKVKRKSP